MSVADRTGLPYIPSMNTILLMVLGLGLANASDIYHWVDQNGNPVFSDQPTEDAKKIGLQQPMTYAPIPVPELTGQSMGEEQQTEEVADAAPEYQLSIVSPENDAEIRANNGEVVVNLQIQPALIAERGDLIQLYLDDLPAGMPQSQLSFMLENIDRGTHKLAAFVLNASGEVIAQSEPVSFHLLRSSIHQPGRQPDTVPRPGAPSIPAHPTTPGFPTPPTP